MATKEDTEVDGSIYKPDFRVLRVPNGRSVTKRRLTSGEYSSLVNVQTEA